MSQFFNIYFSDKNLNCEQKSTQFPRRGSISFPDTSAGVYAAVDFRIFCYKPHLTISKNPLSDKSEMLMVETNNGIFCRFTVDSLGSCRVEAELNDLAVVIFKHYHPPEESRGKRGISGSGFGIRTAVEFLCCLFSYHFDPTENTIDMILNLTPASLHGRNGLDTTSGAIKKDAQGLSSLDANTKYIKLDNEVFTASSLVEVDRPTCVFPTRSPHIRSQQSSCDIVISCEDAFFIADCCYGFVGTFSLLDTMSRLFNRHLNSDDELSVQYKSKYVIVEMECVRLIVVDDMLGLHQPLLQCFVDSAELSFSSNNPANRKSMRMESTKTSQKGIVYLTFNFRQTIYILGNSHFICSM
jgi:hypothetical protein